MVIDVAFRSFKSIKGREIFLGMLLSRQSKRESAGYFAFLRTGFWTHRHFTHRYRASIAIYLNDIPFKIYSYVQCRACGVLDGKGVQFKYARYLKCL